MEYRLCDIHSTAHLIPTYGTQFHYNIQKSQPFDAVFWQISLAHTTTTLLFKTHCNIIVAYPGVSLPFRAYY
jgi:hypothetical protein